MPSLPRIHVREVRRFELAMQTRFPFRYGIASMTELPHVLVQVRLAVDGRSGVGLAAEHLPPKWFTKDPHTRFEEDLPELRRVVAQAARIAEEVGPAESFFAFWRRLHEAQHRWAAGRGTPPLLANLGVSLVERAVLDGLCRLTGRSLAAQVRANTLGIRLGELHPELADAAPGDLLPEQPRRTVAVRHTVGLGDPLTSDDVAPGTAPEDGLPYTLEEAVRAYSLTYFKVKLSGDLPHDTARLLRLAGLLDAEAGADYHLTLDGNEQFRDVHTFRRHWEAYRAEPALEGFFQRLLFVEQPLHRSSALDDEVREALEAWPEHPPLLIDESDAELASLPRALELGYSGTSHKNGKGVVKGIAGACLLAHRRRTAPEGRRLLLSGEDLSTVGPVALLQDLTLMALLGIAHVERNGHHYFRGLDRFPQDVQTAVLEAHGDLYRRHPEGFATLAIQNGRIRLDSVLQAPFGLAPLLEPAAFAEPCSSEA